MKSCITCPFSSSDESAQVQNYGCLPEAHDCVKMYREGKVWMCHSNEDRVCQGLKEHLKEDLKEDLKTNGKTIQTYTNWYHGDPK